MNLTLEQSKSGLRRFDELSSFLDQLLLLSNLIPRGLMTMGDPALSAEANRVYFAQLRGFLEQQQQRIGDNNFNQLSMGMSNDFEAALKEGATMIRVGSAIFGKRPPL